MATTSTILLATAAAALLALLGPVLGDEEMSPEDYVEFTFIPWSTQENPLTGELVVFPHDEVFELTQIAKRAGYGQLDSCNYYVGYFRKVYQSVHGLAPTVTDSAMVEMALKDVQSQAQAINERDPTFDLQRCAHLLFGEAEQNTDEDIEGPNRPDHDKLVLTRAQLHALSRAEHETRKLDSGKRCQVFIKTLRAIFAPQTEESDSVLIRRAVEALEGRKVAFRNSSPYVKPLKDCIPMYE